jgi:hypothetical protein
LRLIIKKKKINNKIKKFICNLKPLQVPLKKELKIHHNPSQFKILKNQQHKKQQPQQQHNKKFKLQLNKKYNNLLNKRFKL